MEQVTSELGAYLRGWRAYFKLADTPAIFRDLDGWIHRRLRALQLKQWKRGRTTYRELHARGLPDWLTQKGAGHGGRWWWAAGLGAMHTALRGITSSGSECPGLLHRPQLTEPPDADPHVRWCGRGVTGESRLPPIPISLG